jgi:hypothetical protein
MLETRVSTWENSYREKKLKNNSQKMVVLLQSGCLMPRQTGVVPPSRTICAYASSVSRTWINSWAFPTVYELLKQDGTCPNDGILIEFIHGAVIVWSSFGTFEIRWRVYEPCFRRQTFACASWKVKAMLSIMTKIMTSL